MFCNLNAEMARKKITITYLAEQLDITPTTLSLKLNGKSELSLKQAFQIKRILNVDIPLEVLFAHDDVKE
jgi:transcriptional regulator with XRE-family HTH domain